MYYLLIFSLISQPLFANQHLNLEKPVEMMTKTDPSRLNQQTAAHSKVRLKSIAHLSGLSENIITGFGLVIGLAGSGDSRRNKDTTQAIANLLQTFGLIITAGDINSRNTATVIVTTNLPSFVHLGDKLDLNVASIGDAKSLLGGTLIATPLKGPDNKIYALAQGPISIGGYKYDAFGNIIQKNHPTTGLIPGGAVVEKNLYNSVFNKTSILHIILNQPDFTTADSIENAINLRFGANTAFAKSAQDIEIHSPVDAKKHFIRFISQLENIYVSPDKLATVVINERTGVVVAGADVFIDAITISHTNLEITIDGEAQIQKIPVDIGYIKEGQSLDSIFAKEKPANLIKLPQGATIAILINELTKAKMSTRDIIAILETIKRTGALHADLVIQ